MFERHVPTDVTILEQGHIVAKKLKDYLLRHPEIEGRLTKDSTRVFLTTDVSERFDRIARGFYGQPIQSKLVVL